MTPQRLEQIQELYNSARDREPGERQRFLAQACAGDDELRREVESLLAQSGGVLSEVMARPAVELAAELLATGHFDSGTLLGPYRIEGILGAGGMGRVYKATDTRLGRPVAIKVSQERFSDRFEREARVIATLNHPNICTLYDVGPNYLVMEFIEGEPLKGPLPVEQAVANALQILDALEAAHAKGIVHRDLKPANILGTKSGVKLLDFGLAKQTRDVIGPDDETETLSLTRTGAVMGTPAYMAPEQWEGKPADARSDIYAFGCVLYEMLTGKRPGADRGPVKPAGLEAILAKCLARNPADRFQTVAEIKPRLQARPATVQRKYVIAAAAALVLTAAGAFLWLRTARSVRALNDTDTVVLAAFTNSTGDKDFDVGLQDGLVEDLQDSPLISVLPDQTVNATLKLMGQKPRVRLTEDLAREVCQRAGSKAYFAASIASLGHQYRVGLKAVNCRTGETLAQTGAEAKGKDDVLAALGKATEKLREKVGESLASIQKSEAGEAAEQASTPSFEAWQLYSKGRTQKLLYTAAGAELFQRAIQLDPNFAMAYLSLGIAQESNGEDNLAAVSMTRAFELRDHASKWEQYAIESRYHFSVSGDLLKARGVYEAWAADYPHRAGYVNLMSVAGQLGEFQKAVQLMRLAVGRDPADETASCWLLAVYVDSNLRSEARAASEEDLKKRPDARCAHRTLLNLAFLENDSAAMSQQLDWANRQEDDEFAELQTSFAAYQGKLEKAREFSRRWIAVSQAKNQTDVAANGEAAAALREALYGNRGEAQKYAQAALKQSQGKRTVYMAALTYALGGDVERARALADDLGTRFPQDTIVRFNYLPAVQALMELNQRNPTNALQDLQTAETYELGAVTAALWPVYVRGLAYLAAHQGAEAAVEFQKLLDHRAVAYTQNGDVPAAPIDALAHVGLARAYALAGDPAKARAAYQEFFAIWKDADPGIPVLKDAQAEFKKLN